MNQLTGNVLITGGSGTLGNAIVRTAKAERWDCSFTIFSRSELRQAQMRMSHSDCRYILGDVRDEDRLASAICGHDLVIHAAAMKRVPECELYPEECFQTNFIGSSNVIHACIRHGIKKCIGISTDKAVRAVTAYGASKLAMEKLFLAQASQPCAFTIVRYGNVVASNGSVVPLWRKQTEAGRPIEITDRRCTRFWMAPSDAVALIARAISASDSPIIVPKMGALSLVEMAEMIAPGAQVKEVGLRSCEKLHEDLVHTDEPAVDQEGHFIIGRGRTGSSYTSEMAFRLNRKQFLGMLDEAENY